MDNEEGRASILRAGLDLGLIRIVVVPPPKPADAETVEPKPDQD